MHDLFSCRNCVHSCSQSANIGRGIGYCLQHDSVIWEPEDTTCKYLHREDLPPFAVDEGIREHAAEFATFSALVSMSTMESVPRAFYSEKHGWEHNSFDVIVNTLAQYHRTERSWVFIEAFSSGLDGRRSLTHAALVRRYMDNCGTWVSSYRLFLAYVQDLDAEPQFSDRDLVVNGDGDVDAVRSEALWDVIFTRVAGVQEYGFHAGLDDLMWATDSLGDALADCNWPVLKSELGKRREEWTDRIISHAKQESVFFAQDEPAPPRRTSSLVHTARRLVSGL
jgi:hypothetical protein